MTETVTISVPSDGPGLWHDVQGGARECLLAQVRDPGERMARRPVLCKCAFGLP